ncbi:MAG: Fe-S cluster assembly protein IscX [Anaerolineales bacterium]|nr:Fe-S cluster assembly protein IscX [Anaerolineales bacterium]MCW5854884.1 Fe-S cluster assembly protein IscX [Anaerolineales bacterium]MCW5878772.1 Fe-S cluster assembly protein IscX [Anaerolineales bacterium]
MAHKLYWDAIYEIALALKASRPQQDLEDVSLGDIFQWTTALPDFADEPELANDDILAAIYQEWYEENNPV